MNVKIHLRAFASPWFNARVLALVLRLLLFLGLFFFYPLIRIFTLSIQPQFALSKRTPYALRTTHLRFHFYQATLSTLLTLLLGLPSAYLFARYDFRGKSLLRALTAVPFMLPTVVVAAGFNALLGPRGWLNLSSFLFLHSNLPAP